MHHLHSKPWLAVECAVLMMGLPLVLYWILPIRYLLPVIWATALLCHLTYRALTRQSTRDWWNRAAVTRTNLRPILQRFAVSALLMAGATWLCAPQLLFGMVRENPAFWLLVMLLYPLLSVVPQEIIFRSFFFARYRTIFTRPPVMVAASALAFAFAHILFHNWVAPVLCLVGGAMFAQTYRRHGSLALAALEHALYGDFIFTVGLGRYFYHGAVVLVQTA